MNPDSLHKKLCSISGEELPAAELSSMEYVGDDLARLIRQDHPALAPNALISYKVLNKYRKAYMEKLMQEQLGELSELEREVLKSMQQRELFSHDVEAELKENLSFGDRLADRIASFGGSWTFIISFLCFILLWVFTNVYILTHRAFDPYPFILLNLILSCLAAIQAPLIMMSQNRQEAKDRQRSRHDYQVNLKAEMEIQQLHEKIDYMMRKQEQRLLEVQQMQVEMLEQILEKLGHK